MKKIKFIPILGIVLIYAIISSIFNYSLYYLSVEDFKHQYYLITIYFTGELFSFILFLLPQNNNYFKNDKLDPNAHLSQIKESINNSSSSQNDNSSLTIDIDLQNNNSNEMDQDSIHFEYKPYIGLKNMSFIITSCLDFISKIILLNGIHFLKSDTLFRTFFLLFSSIILSKYVLNLNFDTNTKFGCFLISFSLGLTAIYYQFSSTINGLYIKSNQLNGLIFCLLAELLTSIQYVIQAKYYLLGEICFFKVIAFEGLFGFIFSILLLFYTINNKCPFADENKNIFCNGKNMENNIFKFFGDFRGENKKWAVIFIISSIFYSLLGSVIIKYNGIISRVSVDVCRVGFWMLQLVLVKNGNLDYLASIICFICIILIFGGMIICSELGEYKINDNYQSKNKKRFRV